MYIYLHVGACMGINLHVGACSMLGMHGHVPAHVCVHMSQHVLGTAANPADPKETYQSVTYFSGAPKDGKMPG